MFAESSGSFVRVPIRSIQVVIDLEDPLSPELTLDDFVRTYGLSPALPRYRILSVEVLTCPEDQLPILASECGHCTRFGTSRGVQSKASGRHREAEAENTEQALHNKVEC